MSRLKRSLVAIALLPFILSGISLPLAIVVYRDTSWSDALALKGAPQEMLKRYEICKDIVGLSGPTGLIKIKGFHDESLREALINITTLAGGAPCAAKKHASC